MRHVIIGNSAAGVSAAETIRRLDPDCEITIIADEDFPAYSRCLLPNLLAGDIDEDRLRFRQRSFYDDNGIKTRLGTKVVGIDEHTKQVVLFGGERLAYDKLLIATGSVTTYPPLEGMDLPGVYGLRNLSDARQIMKDAESARRVVVIGAGLVGLEVAYALYRNGLEVTVVEKATRVVPQQLDHRAAEILRRDMEREGIRLILGVGLKKVVGPSLWQRLFGSSGKGVILEDDHQLKCEMVIVATGARPNIEVVKGTGIQTKRGIVVDQFMTTTVPDIYAAGDVAETVDAVSGDRMVTPIWPNAMTQGRIAAHNMVGQARPYSELIGMQNSLEFREIPAISVGLVNVDPKEYEVLTTYRPESNLYKKMVIKDGILHGFVLVGDISTAGVLSALVKTHRPVEGFKHQLLADNFGYELFLAKSVASMAK